jgi:hypothetical protein
MKTLFKDPAHQAFFEEHGWIKVPLLDASQVAQLLAYYQNLPKDEQPMPSFHLTLDRQSRTLRAEVAAKITEVLGNKADAIFVDHQVFIASYVVKEQDPLGFVPPHLDWTFVDEKEFNSLAVWTTLVPTNLDNGCMAVLSGSHHYFDYVRPSPSQSSHIKPPVIPHAYTLFSHMQLVPMAAGEALIFDNRTIHASLPNNTPQSRVAVALGVTHKDAKLLHHYLLPNQSPETIESYAVKPDFFVQYNDRTLVEVHRAGQRPEGGQRIGSLVQRYPEFTTEEILAKVQTHPDNKLNAEVVRRLAPLRDRMSGSQKAEAPTPEAAPAPPQPSKFRRLLSQIFH